MNPYEELLNCGNLAIVDMAMKCEAVFSTHNKAYVGISGGADSDVMLDLCERVRQVQPIDIHYEFTNTGIEYQATKDHLAYLDDRYGVSIRIAPPDRTIPQCVRKYGSPFMSKMVSHQISKLQRGGFRFEDKPLPILKLEYPDVIESALKWWTNSYSKTVRGYTSYDIGRNKWLKEFMTENPPTFAISEKCCNHAKKTPSHRSARVRGCDLNMVGVRRAEGGVRVNTDKCFTKGRDYDVYRPLNWLKNEDRAEYVRMFGITHSDCYTKWGLVRTGCVGCPFNANVIEEMDLVEQYEPKVVRCARHVFSDSYEYTIKYREFRARKEGRLSLDI